MSSLLSTGQRVSPTRVKLENLHCDLHVLVVFIELSASARVLKEPTTADCAIGFSATTEQCLVVASCTTQYSSGAIASAGTMRAEEMIPTANVFCIGLSPMDFLPLSLETPSAPPKFLSCPVLYEPLRDAVYLHASCITGPTWSFPADYSW